MPRVSVVIITFNHGQFIAEAIQSVLDQTFRDFETIVVDDGSTDNTANVVSRFPVKYSKQGNLGVCRAYNRGADLSTGEYLYFLDADDVLLEGTLKKEVELLDSHPEVAFCYGQANMMTEQRHIYRVRKSTFLTASGVVDGKQQIRELLFTNRITSSSVMMRRRCFDEVGRFDERIGAIAEDRHLYIRLAKKYPLAYIAEPLVKYRVHPTQTHKTVTYDVAETAFSYILQEVFGDPNIAPQFARWRAPAYSYAYRRLGDYAYGDNMRIARSYYWKSFRAYPRIVVQKSGLSLAYKYISSLLPAKLRMLADSLKARLWDSRLPSE
jgi:glycosyltransferase involved in cell wall biosynthesis